MLRCRVVDVAVLAGEVAACSSGGRHLILNQAQCLDGLLRGRIVVATQQGLAHMLEHCGGCERCPRACCQDLDGARRINGAQSLGARGDALDGGITMRCGGACG